MKIRIYSPCFPHPITEGMHQIVADQITTFMEMGLEVELVVVLETREQVEKKAAPTLSSLEAKGLQVFFLNRHPAKGTEPTGFRRKWRVARSLLSPFASPEMYHYPLAFRRKRPKGEVDWAIYHYSFAYIWMIKKPLRGEKRSVVYLHNLESELFDLRAQSARPGLEKSLHELNAKKLRQHERILSALCDELWFLSPVDRRELLDYSGRTLFRLTPPTYSESLRRTRHAAFLIRKPSVKEMRAGFIGGLDFLPNYQSAKWLLEQVVPRLAEAGFQGKILIAGKGASEELKALAEPFSFVEFTGFVESLEKYWSQLSLNLVPHISGSGVRMKLLEGVASGVPSLANWEAIRRLHPEVQKSPFVVRCDKVEDWVRCLMEEKPFQTRQALMKVPHNLGLTGSKIYDFLKGQGSSPERDRELRS